MPLFLALVKSVCLKLSISLSKTLSSYCVVHMVCRKHIEAVECPSVCLSVCPVDRQQQRRRAAGLLLSSGPVPDIDWQLSVPCTGCLCYCCTFIDLPAGVICVVCISNCLRSICLQSKVYTWQHSAPVFSRCGRHKLRVSWTPSCMTNSLSSKLSFTFVHF